MAENTEPKHWLQTLPGLLTALAGLIGAVAALIVAIHGNGKAEVVSDKGLLPTNQHQPLIHLPTAACRLTFGVSRRHRIMCASLQRVVNASISKISELRSAGRRVEEHMALTLAKWDMSGVKLSKETRFV